MMKKGDIVTGAGNLGVPAAIRNFKPLKDAEKERDEYNELRKDLDELDPKLAAFCVKMVYPPWEGGTRYRIIEGEKYEILIEGNYSELFIKENESKSKGATASIYRSQKNDS